MDKNNVSIKILSFYGIISTICDASNHLAWAKALTNSDDELKTLVKRTLQAGSNHTLVLKVYAAALKVIDESSLQTIRKSVWKMTGYQTMKSALRHLKSKTIAQEQLGNEILKVCSQDLINNEVKITEMISKMPIKPKIYDLDSLICDLLTFNDEQQKNLENTCPDFKSFYFGILAGIIGWDCWGIPPCIQPGE